jgi:hypothetical protein
MSPSRSPVVGPTSGNPPHRPDDEKISQLKRREDSESEGQESSEEVETQDKIEDIPWITVKRRRTCSQESLINKRKPLTSEQTQAIRKATESITADQRQRIE